MKQIFLNRMMNQQDIFSTYQQIYNENSMIIFSEFMELKL